MSFFMVWRIDFLFISSDNRKINLQQLFALFLCAMGIISSVN